MKNILIHGLGQTSSSWNNTTAKIDKHLDVTCPNLTELLHGKEVNYANLYGSFSEYCITHLEKLNICGLSLGGILGLQYAIENPTKVNSIVLIGTQYIMPKKLLKLQNAIFHIMPNSIFKQMGFGKRDFINLSKSMMDLDFHNDLKNIHCPTLIICGEKDSANKKASIELKELIPHAELQIIANAGHEVNVDAPETLAEVLNRFLEG